MELLDRILLTGPYAEELYNEADKSDDKLNILIDPDFSLINSYSLLQKGIILYNNNDTQNKEVIPLYLRKSEAELSLDKRKG